MDDGKMQRKQLGIRVLLFPLPFHGHMNPMLHLGNALYSKGFSIDIIQTRFNSPDPVIFPNFSFHFIEDGLKTKPGDSFDALSAIKAGCLVKFRDCLSQILNISNLGSERIACLITDPSWEFSGIVADSFDLPRIALRTGSILSYYVYEALPLLRNKGYFPVTEGQLDEPVLELPPLKFRDLPAEEHHELMMNMVKESKTYSQGIICNAFNELEAAVIDRTLKDHHPIPIFSVGPLHKYSSSSSSSITQDQSCISWLNMQEPKSVLYVSFGSAAAITKEEFSEVAWGLANSKQPYLWVVRSGLIKTSGKEEDDPFPDGLREAAGKRGCIVKWAPQIEVLAHSSIGGFWTHCGWNSTMESICEGVPMICLPFFLDQKMNARHVSDVWKIGVILEKGLKRDEIERTIRRVMEEEEGRDMRERAAVLREKANLSIMEGGSSDERLNELSNHILALMATRE